MRNHGGHLYPDTADEITSVFESRKNRDSHPFGSTDNGGRWYPSEYEQASCCKAIRSPSRAHPYSYMVHCRTKKHVETWYAEHVMVRYEYFRAGTRTVWHVAPAFSGLSLPERNQGKSLCGYSVSNRHDSTLERPENICEKCAAKVGEGIGLGVGFGFGARQQQPLNELDVALERVMCDRLRAYSLDELKARRAECVDHALRCYRLLRTAHPSDRRITAEDVTYWIRQAYFAHGEILAQARAASRYDDGVWDTNGNQIS